MGSNMREDQFEDLTRFLGILSKARVAYDLRLSRDDAIMVSVRTPLQMWEIEFMGTGWHGDARIQVERLRSDGVVDGPSVLVQLLEELDADGDLGWLQAGR
jgi:hypothetical protein